MFRGSELPRLMGMLALLGILGLVVFRAGDSITSRWLVQDSGATDTAEAPPAETAAKKSVKEPLAETLSPGPTDEDPEQREDAREEFQAVADGTLGVQPEEMFAYWRLFNWVEHQSTDALRGRARSLAFNDLMQFPDKHRGRLVRLDLNVRRVLAYEVEDCPLGFKRLYEIWGWSDDSKAWLYCVVTAHLPEGMPIGADVYERARFVGYFFKLQGYLEAGAKPRARPLRAPLLVGRIHWYPWTAEAPSKEFDWRTLGAAAGGMTVLAGAIVFLYTYRSRKAARQRLARQQQPSADVRQWLNEDFAAGGDMPACEDPAAFSADRCGKLAGAAQGPGSRAEIPEA